MTITTTIVLPSPTALRTLRHVEYTDAVADITDQIPPSSDQWTPEQIERQYRSHHVALAALRQLGDACDRVRLCERRGL